MKKPSLFMIPAMILFVVAVMVSCLNDDPDPPHTTIPYELPVIEGFPKNLNIPEDNPLTEEGVKLGRYLFHDGRLSGRLHPDSLMSCATCHVQEKGFEAGIDHPKFKGGQPVGIPSEEYPQGKPTPHFMLPTINLVYNHNGYLWNGSVHETNEELGSPEYGVPADPAFHRKSVEAFAWMAIVAPHEINGDLEKTVETIENIPIYPPMFEAAYGSPEVSIEKISKSIAQYVRTIVSYRSKYHQWLRGEAELTPAEQRGYDLFFSETADCFHCHSGVLLTTNQFYNNAKDSVFDGIGDRYSVTKKPWDLGAFRAPSLINCEITAPYMHDGRFKTLEEVVDFYSEGLVSSDYVHPLMKGVSKGGVRLDPQEKSDLIAFLKTFTDHALLEDPAYSKPSDLHFDR